MKNIICLLAIFVSTVVFAATTKKIAVEEFKKVLKNEINSIQVDEGSLEDIEGTCNITTALDQRGRTEIVISTVEGLRFAVVIGDNDQIQLTTEAEQDGSYVKTYKFGLTKQVRFVHFDDGYDTATLSNGKTKLTCGVYY